MELRDYQKDLLKQVQTALQDSPQSRVMLQLPTGGGKTRIAGALLSEWLEGGRKAVWLTHRRELAAQTEGMLQEDQVSATKDIRWTPGTKAPVLPNGAVILMAQTVSRRTASAEVWDNYDTLDLMIVDEAHHATAEGWARAMRQWPGPVLGMTATPWRLSEREGFDHLFGELVCGPQVAALQSKEWLCNARVLSPPEEELVEGGQVDTTGEYSEAGIEEANRERDIWTAGALRFWQKNSEGRQTIVYAVSVRHARNLASVFNDAGIPAGVLVGDTPDTERTLLISRFQSGDLRVLVNVAVATEGFDLPDASCVLMTRPTMSLALYLQMVGRGLRPKPDSGDCVVLDMTGNSRRHGLPEVDREWSLRARSEQTPGPGEAPLIRCEKCEALSPASNHNCDNCGEPFGEHCGRCGAWRAWKRWSSKTICSHDHELVCDLCHKDAHVEAKLPVTQELEELEAMNLIRNMLEEECHRIGGATDDRKADLRSSIEQLETDLKDDNLVAFKRHLDSLPDAQRPVNDRQRYALFGEWERELKEELEGLKGELARLEAQSVDGQLVLRNVRERLLQLLEAEAREVGLLPRNPIPLGPPDSLRVDVPLADSPGSGEWITFVQLAELGKMDQVSSIRPIALQLPRESPLPVKNWINLLEQTAEWLVSKELLTKDICPFTVGRMTSRYMVNSRPNHPGRPTSKGFKQLSNGLYLHSQHSAKQIAQLCAPMVKKLGEDPEQFMVQFSQ